MRVCFLVHFNDR